MAKNASRPIRYVSAIITAILPITDAEYMFEPDLQAVVTYAKVNTDGTCAWIKIDYLGEYPSSHVFFAKKCGNITYMEGDIFYFTKDEEKAKALIEANCLTEDEGIDCGISQISENNGISTLL